MADPITPELLEILERNPTEEQEAYAIDCLHLAEMDPFTACADCGATWGGTCTGHSGDWSFFNSLIDLREPHPMYRELRDVTRTDANCFICEDCAVARQEALEGVA